MHQTRQETTTKLPLPRKGTKYVVRAFSHLRESVPVLIAIRDMLHLAKTANEVKSMIKQKLLKLNGKVVEDPRESIRLFNVLEAGKTYGLTLLSTGKFSLEEQKEKNKRLCKVVNKKLLGKGKIQLNFHDGTNIISNEKIDVGDSVYLDFESKIKSCVSLGKGADIFVMSGKYSGLTGKVESVKNEKVKIKLENKVETELDKSQV